MIRVAINGYGNLGRGAERAIARSAPRPRLPYPLIATLIMGALLSLTLWPQASHQDRLDASPGGRRLARNEPRGPRTRIRPRSTARGSAPERGI